jgi:hypothetical protein
LEVEAENAIPMHVGFVQEKLESGLFWRIFNSLKTAEERLSLFTDWGRLFEEYVSRILVQCCAASGENYSPFPKFSDNGDEAFDGVISSGKYWVVMEYKGGFLNSNAKYTEDEEEFIKDLEKKFGERGRNRTVGPKDWRCFCQESKTEKALSWTGLLGGENCRAGLDCPRVLRQLGSYGSLFG